jgi:phosphoglycolate phosphatase-like HAD superfamily hydrolase
VDSTLAKARAYYDIFHDVPESAALVEAVKREDPYASRFEIVRRVLRRAGRESDAAVEEYVARFSKVTEDHQATCGEIPGAEALLARLGARLPVFVCSGTFEPSLLRVLERRRWRGYFRDVFGGPEKKTKNLGRLPGDIDRSRVLVVGDTRDDLEAAEMHGCRFAGILSPITDFDPAGRTILRSLADVEGLLGC